MSFLTNRVTVVCGHYGTGKTNLSINLAMDAADEGDKVTLIDMDVVNPYFRSSDYAEMLTEKGVRVIGPNFANSNLDTPSLPAAIGDAIGEGERVIIDVGGDDAGATALGVYRKQLAQSEPDVIYVINRYRSQTTSPEEAVAILREIERAAGIRATCLANNSHLKEHTTEDTVLESLPFAEKVSELTGLPIRFTTSPVGLNLLNKTPQMYHVRVYVKAPWEKAGNRIAQSNR